MRACINEVWDGYQDREVLNVNGGSEGEVEGVDDVESVTYELRVCVCNHSCIEYD